jgi:hypothetical protein
LLGVGASKRLPSRRIVARIWIFANKWRLDNAWRRSAECAYLQTTWRQPGQVWER